MDLDLGVGTYRGGFRVRGDARVVSLKTSDIEPSEQASLEFGIVRTEVEAAAAKAPDSRGEELTGTP